MTNPAGSAPGLMRVSGRLVGLLFAGMLVVQAVGVGFAWAMFGGFGIASEGPQARKDRSFASEPVAAN